MNRPGHLRYPPRSLAQYLLDHSRPAFVKAVDVAPDVPLIAIFSGEEAFAADLIMHRPEGDRDEPSRPSRLPPTPSPG
jgi:hypothetical protein